MPEEKDPTEPSVAKSTDAFDRMNRKLDALQEGAARQTEAVREVFELVTKLNAMVEILKTAPLEFAIAQISDDDDRPYLYSVPIDGRRRMVVLQPALYSDYGFVVGAEPPEYPDQYDYYLSLRLDGGVASAPYPLVRHCPNTRVCDRIEEICQEEGIQFLVVLDPDQWSKRYDEITYINPTDLSPISKDDLPRLYKALSIFDWDHSKLGNFDLLGQISAILDNTDSPEEDGTDNSPDNNEGKSIDAMLRDADIPF